MDKSKGCSVCLVVKRLTDFGRKVSARDGRHSRCLECQKVASRKHYQANKAAYVERAQSARRARARSPEMQQLLSSRCCRQCGATAADTGLRRMPSETRTRSPVELSHLGYSLRRISAQIACEIAFCDQCYPLSPDRAVGVNAPSGVPRSLRHAHQVG